MENITKKIQLFAIAISIVAPCVLTAGYGYYIGGLAAFGVDNSLFDRGFGDVITESWLMAVKLVLYVWEYIWWFVGYWVFLLLALSGFFYWVGRNKAKGITVNFLEKCITKENPGVVIFGMTQWAWRGYFGFLGEFSALLWWPVLAVMLALLLAIIPFKMAHKYSLEVKVLIDKHGCHPSTVVEVKYKCIQLFDTTKSPNQLLAEGILVGSDTKRVAIYSNKVVEVWPLLDSYKITKIVK